MGKSARNIPVREKLKPRDDKKEPNPLPDGSDALRDEIIQSLGQEWLNTKNEWLYFKTPDEVIGTPEEDRLRDIVRSILVAALS